MSISNMLTKHEQAVLLAAKNEWAEWEKWSEEGRLLEKMLKNSFNQLRLKHIVTLSEQELLVDKLLSYDFSGDTTEEKIFDYLNRSLEEIRNKNYSPK